MLVSDIGADDASAFNVATHHLWEWSACIGDDKAGSNQSS
jgi:hypothetical protein